MTNGESNQRKGKNALSGQIGKLIIAIPIIVLVVAVVFVLAKNFKIKSIPKIANAGTASLSWNPSTESDLAGYKIYYGTAKRTADCPIGGYPNVIDAGKATTYTISNLTEGLTYYFSTTVIDTSGKESCFSAEVSKLIPEAR